MEALLDFSLPFNSQLFDSAISAFYNVKDPNNAAASKFVHEFREKEGVWKIVFDIVEKCQNKYSIFYGLNILEEFVKYKWYMVPVEERNTIKDRTVQNIITITSSATGPMKDPSIISKWNLVLIEILKKEWPDNWPSFVSDLVGSSKVNEDLCDNNIIILKLLVEDVFQYNQESLTSQRSEKLQTELKTDLGAIFDLCLFAFANSNRPSLLINAIDVIRVLLPYIDSKYIYETEVVDNLLQYFAFPQYRCTATKCLMDIFNSEKSKQFPARICTWISKYMELLVQHLPLTDSLASSYMNCSEEEIYFIQSITMFLTTVIATHRDMLISQNKTELLLFAIRYINMLSVIPETELLKLCVTFYNNIASAVYNQESKSKPVIFVSAVSQDNDGIYKDVFPQIREILIDHMAKPEEILVAENDDGEVVREERQDTDTIALYLQMKETLVFLTHLNYDNTEQIMLKKMEIQMNLGPSDPFRHSLQTLSWAVGSISGVTDHNTEKRLLIAILSDLLRLCVDKVTKDDKAVVAACVMYVIQMYPGFLNTHWTFLRTVVLKTFNFMHETHPGVQDMACDTFYKVVKKCAKQFIIPQENKEKTKDIPFIEDILQHTDDYCQALQPIQMERYYSSIALIIKACSQESIKLKYIDICMRKFNEQWSQMIQQAGVNSEYLKDNEVMKSFRQIIRFNTVMVESLGDSYTNQLGLHFSQLCDLYKFYSENMQIYLNEKGVVAIGHVVIRYMRNVNREILRYIKMYIDKCKKNDATVQQLLDTFVPMTLNCYRDMPNIGKDSEMLSFLTLVVTKCHGNINHLVTPLLDAVYGGTLSLITSSTEDFPEIRLEFYNLLAALSQYSFDKLFDYAPEQQNILIGSIIWGFKHTSREICETSIKTMQEILTQARNTNDEVRQPFYKNFLINILAETMYVLTDRMHIGTFALQCSLLQLIFTIILSGNVTVPLFENTPNDVGTANYIFTIITTAFPNISPNHVNEFLSNVGSTYKKSEINFRTVVRDFLIQLKEFSNNRDALFATENEQMKQQLILEDLERKKMVPGLLNPNEVEDPDL
ncbi:hypothetical protein WA158_006505 [Blastocystis sp. Blastoise]